MPIGTTLRSNLLLTLCAIVLATGATGCSFLFVDGPPATHRQLPYFICSTSRSWPVVDTILAADFVINTAAVINEAKGSNSSELALALLPGVVAALATASAVYGYSSTADCREATDELQERLIRMPPAPGANPWPPDGSAYHPVPYSPPVAPWLTPPPPASGSPAQAPKSPKEER